MSLTATTELEAVNIMLGSIGESPVNAISSGLSEANTAKTILSQTSRQLQMRGWFFNSEIIKLSTDNAKHIHVPNNTLKVDTGLERVIWRGKRLYDRLNNSYEFAAGLPVGLVLGLAFDELPETARNYITVRASRIFQDRTVGASDLHGFQSVDEQAAYNLLEEAENENGNYNLFDNAELRAMNGRSSSHVIRHTSGHVPLEQMVLRSY